ncbi:MAG TPA: Maf family protein, partial [Microthrixaceae bacterium]|nr:Maf family protein [Microthrixaceae bacterium]
LDGELLGKPADADDAGAMLNRLSGRAHDVLTGVAVARGGDVDGIVEVSRVWFRSLGRAEIEDYVATGEPLDKAGSYAIQGLGGAFVERTEGTWDNIVGLPMAVVARLLAERGGLSGRS